MQTQDIFKMVRTGPGRNDWRLELKRPVRLSDGRVAYTTDALRTTDPAASQLSWKGSGRFRDTILSAETTARNPVMNGTVWAGDIKAQLDALSAADRKTALDAMRRVLDDYAKTSGDYGNTSGMTGDEGSFAAGATPEQMNDAARAYWDKANRHVTRDLHAPANDEQAQIQKMQRANDLYWAAQTAHQRTPVKEWGKG